VSGAASGGTGVRRALLLGVLAGFALAARVDPARAQPADPTALAAEVRQTELAFARTMADRDHAGFVSFLADETVFLGETRTLRGKAEVADAWKRYYEGPRAPFSWEPDRVEVLDSGTLALSSGPVYDPEGRRAGTFNSVWRREGPGRWRIVFDKGCPPCRCEPPAK
jgi:ketosteroid isomerase-like protein